MVKNDNNKKAKNGQASKAVSRALAQICISLSIILVTLNIFFKLDNYTSTEFLIFIDKVIPEFVYIHRSPLLNEIMKVISFFGNELLVAAALVFASLLVIKNKIKDAIIFISVLFTGFYFNLVLKELYMRPRPEILPLAQELSYSFPSGHSMNSFIFYTIFSYYIFRHSRNKKFELITALISFFLIIAVGYSRIYLGVHYPSDVLAGFAAGLFFFACILLIEKIFFLMYFLRQKK